MYCIYIILIMCVCAYLVEPLLGRLTHWSAALTQCINREIFRLPHVWTHIHVFFVPCWPTNRFADSITAIFIHFPLEWRSAICADASMSCGVLSRARQLWPGASFSNPPPVAMSFCMFLLIHPDSCLQLSNLVRYWELLASKEALHM